jgi:hypothetical protein
MDMIMNLCFYIIQEFMISITYSECVFVTLAIQNAISMLRIIFPSVVCPAVPYFSTLLHKRKDFREKVSELKMCLSIFCTIFVRKISQSKKN